MDSKIMGRKDIKVVSSHAVKESYIHILRSPRVKI